MSEHDGRPTDWSKLMRPYMLPGEVMRDRIAALEHELRRAEGENAGLREALTERDRRIAELEAKLEARLSELGSTCARCSGELAEETQ